MRKRTNTRKGKSRIFSVRLLLFFGTLMVVGLLLLASMLGGRFGALHQLTLDLIGPLQKVVAVSTSGLDSFKDKYLDIWSTKEENERLLALVAKYQQELSEFREGYRKYRHYEELLDFKEQHRFNLLTARVVGKDPAFWLQTIVIDRGEDDDVEEGMVALSPQGVVGQVVHTSNNYAKILLANAPSSAIDALVQKNRIRGILKGAGKDGYTLQYVLKNTDVSVGDDIVTAGIGGVFESGIPLGKVSAVHLRERGMFQEIEVTPSVDFSRLEVVFIDLNDRRKIRNKLQLDEKR